MLDALGDPTRRAVLEELRAGPLAVGVLAQRLPISRPAVSQHLKVLEGAGLVRSRSSGTRRLYGLDGSGVTVLRDYLDRMWGSTLDAFASLAHDEAARRTEQP